MISEERPATKGRSLYSQIIIGNFDLQRFLSVFFCAILKFRYSLYPWRPYFLSVFISS